MAILVLAIADHVVAAWAELVRVVLSRPPAHDVLHGPHGVPVDVGAHVRQGAVRMEGLERRDHEGVPDMRDAGMISIPYPHDMDITVDESSDHGNKTLHDGVLPSLGAWDLHDHDPLDPFAREQRMLPEPAGAPRLHVDAHEHLPVGVLVRAVAPNAQAVLGLKIVGEPAAQSWSKSDNDEKNKNGNHANNNNSTSTVTTTT